MKNRKDLILLSLLVLIWGGNWANLKIGLTYVTPMNSVFQRLFFSTFMIAPFLLLCKNGIRRDYRTLAKVVVLSAAWAFSMIFMMVALEFESSGTSSIITYTQPLFVFALSAIFLKNEITKVKVAGVLLGFAGIGIIYLDRIGSQAAGGSILPILLLILGAFLWAVSIVCYKTIAAAVHPYWISFFQVSIGSIIVFPLAILTGGISFPYELTYILSLVYLTVIATVLGFFLWFYLIKNEDTTTVSSSTLTIPIVAFIIGAIVLGEPVNPLQIVGIIMVLTGVYLVNR